MSEEDKTGPTSETAAEKATVKKATAKATAKESAAGKAAVKKASAKKATAKKAAAAKKAAPAKRAASKAGTKPAGGASFRFTRRDDDIAVIEIDVPGDAQNTLKAELAEELAAAMKQVRGDGKLRGVVLISTKPGSSVAGADIQMLERAQTATEVEKLSTQSRKCRARRRAAPAPSRRCARISRPWLPASPSRATRTSSACWRATTIA